MARGGAPIVEDMRTVLRVSPGTGMRLADHDPRTFGWPKAEGEKALPGQGGAVESPR